MKSWNIWQENKTVTLSPVIFPPDILSEAQDLYVVLVKTGQLAMLPGSAGDLKTFQVAHLEPRKYVRRYDPHKATRGGTFALVALTETLKPLNPQNDTSRGMVRSLA